VSVRLLVASLAARRLGALTLARYELPQLVKAFVSLLKPCTKAGETVSHLQRRWMCELGGGADTKRSPPRVRLGPSPQPGPRSGVRRICCYGQHAALEWYRCSAEILVAPNWSRQRNESESRLRCMNERFRLTGSLLMIGSLALACSQSAGDPGA